MEASVIDVVRPVESVCDSCCVEAATWAFAVSSPVVRLSLPVPTFVAADVAVAVPFVRPVVRLLVVLVPSCNADRSSVEAPLLKLVLKLLIVSVPNCEAVACRPAPPVRRLLFKFVAVSVPRVVAVVVS